MAPAVQTTRHDEAHRHVSSPGRCWHILGAGALGSVLAGQFAHAGLPCELLTHRSEGGRVRVLPADGGAPLDLAIRPLTHHGAQSIDRLLLTTKAFRVAEALRLAAPLLSADAVVLCIANGIGFEADARAALGERPLYRAVTTEAALRESTTVVRHTGRGRTLVGAADTSPAAPWFADSLARLPGWQWSTDIGAELLRKFAINCVINPLTTLFRCNNGALLAAADKRAALLALCEETQDALSALALWPGDASLAELSVTVCEHTAANRSSMLQDALAGRETELAYLNGHLLELGAAAGLALPHNADIVARLSQGA
jgi:2-dehydropantoate 2-reductase